MLFFIFFAPKFDFLWGIVVESGEFYVTLSPKFI
jgi:hypothetical protein